MASAMIRRMRYGLGAVASAAGLVAAGFVYAQPDRVSDRFLRIGGRIVLKLANRVDVVAAVFAATVIVIWVAIGARCLIEAWAERRQRRQTAARSVANSESRQ